MYNRIAPIEVWYRRIGKASVGAVLFLILVGGIVRSTGSGMGCPDWPKCFGLLIPPTELSGIPSEFFAIHPEYHTQEFNVFQTWTEYINRLIGVLIGLFALATATLSVGFIKKDRRVFFLSVAALVMVVFEGWLGKLVVDMNLAGGMVTLHMLVAMVIVATLITAVYLADSHVAEKRATRPKGLPGHLIWLGTGVVLVTLAQILVGTQVREGVDLIASELNMKQRETWIDSLGGYYNFHKVAWVVLVVGMVIWARDLLQAEVSKQVRLFVYVILFCLFTEVLFGLLLSYLGLPPVLQALHLVLATVIFAAQFAVLINLLGIERVLNKRVGKNEIDNQTLANAK